MDQKETLKIALPILKKKRLNLICDIVTGNESEDWIYSNRDWVDIQKLNTLIESVETELNLP